jgi:UDP-N-acetylglucosamine--N-acetylmuramyl-(pentapeptide) pyrophosphoryl-undecaprenol N-acetylglucosamine transferase
MKNKTIYRFIFAGGGTGGHLYPALAVAQKLKELKPESEILFVGTKNKIEAKAVPEYGFNFKSIWISGFSRKINLSNLLFPVKLIVSMAQSLLINMKFKPRVVVGSGAYVSGPVVWAASVMGSKIILLEQNSYPGVTNRILEKRVDEVHITFDESKKYFRQPHKLILSGNPVRINLKLEDKIEALKKFGLSDSKKTLLIIGGSGGAKSLNDAVAKNIVELTKKGIQVIWQTGAYYYEQYKNYERNSVRVMPFVNDMSAVYSACDLLIARAGATTIAEVAYLGLPVIFVPSVNVAANHQFKNAKAIVDANAAVMIEDKDLANNLLDKTAELIFDENKIQELKKNISAFAYPDAANKIASRAIELAEKI